MALSMSLLSCLLLACALNVVSGQPLPESIFKVLSAEELRDISLRQNPDLLDLAARTGESVRIEMTAASQGAIVQEGVNTILDCGPWLKNFPGGTVRWYLFDYEDLDHTTLGMRTEQTPDDLSAAETQRATITGEFNEVFTIVRALISTDAEDSSSGVYECEVCIARDSVFQVCHSASVTVAIAGRPPIIDKGMGRTPEMETENLDTYKIGATICLFIDPFDPTRNDPKQLARLQCADVGKVDSLNIPSAIPSSVFTWTHTSLDGDMSAPFAINRAPDAIDDATYVPPPEFGMTFPALVGPNSPFTVSTEDTMGTSALDFSLANITRNFSDPRYLALRQAFGVWTCTLNNSLGMETETTLITDACGEAIPSIVRDCSNIGTSFGNGAVYLVDRSTSAPVIAGCDVCVEPGTTLALTLTCPTNIGSFPGVSITGYEWTDSMGNLLSVAAALTVVEPGSYTCTVFFGEEGSDSTTSTVGFAPDVDIEFTRKESPTAIERSKTSGCERLRKPYPVEPDDVCGFFVSSSETLEQTGEIIEIRCVSEQEGVTTFPIIIEAMGIILNASAIEATQMNDQTVVGCSVATTDPTIDDRCSEAARLTINTFEPAKILVSTDDSCTGYAGEFYAPVDAPGDGGVAILCCDAFGYPEPETGWFKVVFGIDGVAFEVPVNVNDSDINLDVVTNRLSISNYDPATDDGTYVCRAENIAGIDVATIAITSSMPGTRWATSEWCDCDPFCVDGSRSRRVWCETAPEGVVVPDTRCDCTTKPPSVETCTNVPGLDECFLTPLWKTGEFSKCSRGCSGGVRFREVYCALPLDGRRVENHLCVDLYGPQNTPPSYDICFNTCCVRDSYPEYCRSTGTGPCHSAVYQQYCCWTCGLTVIG